MTTHVDIRDAQPADRPHILEAVHELLRELTGDQDRQVPGMGTALDKILTPGYPGGGVLVATVPHQPGIVGLLSWSRITALRTGGDYIAIEELWADPRSRSQRVGSLLIEGLRERARKEGLTRLEVGLPRPAFPGSARTQRFYLGQGFRELGPRMTLEVD
ncbi:GNAT family N-acetyltransferase [Streptomyces gobiensis]|uniref:GNAT family N-acetyltransferase n=1 Tax=Streptomyces gobiensis TaxID=2875706 RepID=UPI001E46525A|nr:GNAT family N-acetyltransferase [Streptomyces gobiensis]UGY93859.1 GNAT family N-acetyltransferase [Streptomyces gobiensis]